jgi:hypothetical protein
MGAICVSVVIMRISIIVVLTTVASSIVGARLESIKVVIQVAGNFFAFVFKLLKPVCQDLLAANVLQKRRKDRSN